jgi:hypothetical protein
MSGIFALRRQATVNALAIAVQTDHPMHSRRKNAGTVRKDAPEWLAFSS